MAGASAFEVGAPICGRGLNGLMLCSELSTALGAIARASELSDSLTETGATASAASGGGEVVEGCAPPLPSSGAQREK